MGYLFFLLGLSYLLYWASHSSKSVVSQSTTTGGSSAYVEGTVYINGTTPIGMTDYDFVCATLDWWPPEKCDYGTCSWGNASLLNLVSTLSLFAHLLEGKKK